jgi:hypothetical protein
VRPATDEWPARDRNKIALLRSEDRGRADLHISRNGVFPTPYGIIR